MFKTEAERIFLEEDEILSEELNKKVSLQDFELVKLLGEGSFGKVVLVKKRDTGIFYAMKILKKKVIEERKQTKNTKEMMIILLATATSLFSLKQLMNLKNLKAIPLC